MDCYEFIVEEKTEEYSSISRREGIVDELARHISVIEAELKNKQGIDFYHPFIEQCDSLKVWRDYLFMNETNNILSVSQP